MGLQERIVKSGLTQATLGLCFAFILGLIGLGGTILCLIKGKALEGSILGGATLATLVGTFVYGTRLKSKDNKS